MERIHEDDLAGFFVASGRWKELRLPAIVEEDSAIAIGLSDFHHRRKGDLLDPRRLDQAFLDEKKIEMGSVAFQAQYQQAPLPAEGYLIKREWLCSYSTPPDLASARIIQSVDTAQKTEPSNDLFVITTSAWIEHRHYILDVFRARCAFPTLRQKNDAA
jgi:hypothetical protein